MTDGKPHIYRVYGHWRVCAWGRRPRDEQLLCAWDGPSFVDLRAAFAKAARVRAGAR